MPDASPPGDDERGRGLARVTAFSDGVFAIAMTLLVVSLTTPDIQSGDVDEKLRRFLSEEWGQLLGYALNFYVIAKFWMAHHRLFRSVRFAPPPLIALNLVLLGFIAFLPFPTGIMGRYGETTTAAVFYAATMAVTGLLSLSLFEYAIRSGAVDADSLAVRGHSLPYAALLPVIFLASIPVAFWDPEAATIMWSALIFSRWLGTRKSPAPTAS